MFRTDLLSIISSLNTVFTATYCPSSAVSIPYSQQLAVRHQQSQYRIHSNLLSVISSLNTVFTATYCPSSAVSIPYSHIIYNISWCTVRWMPNGVTCMNTMISEIFTFHLTVNLTLLQYSSHCRIQILCFMYYCDLQGCRKVPRVRLDALENREITCHFLDLNPTSSVFQHVA
jgi:hypothetical protein